MILSSIKVSTCQLLRMNPYIIWHNFSLIWDFPCFGLQMISVGWHRKKGENDVIFSDIHVLFDPGYLDWIPQFNCEGFEVWQYRVRVFSWGPRIAGPTEAAANTKFLKVDSRALYRKLVIMRLQDEDCVTTHPLKFEGIIRASKRCLVSKLKHPNVQVMECVVCFFSAFMKT